MSPPYKHTRASVQDRTYRASELERMPSIAGYLRRPLARCKTLDTGLDRGIDEILLDGARWIVLSSSEGKHSMHASESLRQLLWVLIVRLDPSHRMLR